MYVDNRILYSSLGNDADVLELRDDMKYMAARRPRKPGKNDFIDTNFEELSSTFLALQDYLATYSMPFLQDLDFTSFCNFCFLYSHRSR